MVNKVNCHCCNRLFEDHLVLTCCICHGIFGNLCIGLTSSEIRIISSKKSISWSCKDCEKIGNDIQSLKSVIVSLQKEIKELKTSVQSVSGDISHEFTDEKFEEVIAEIEERQMRKRNVIVYGVEELGGGGTTDERIKHDHSMVSKLFDEIAPDVSRRSENIRVFRLGKFNPRSDKPRPLKVSLKSWDEVLKILKKSKTLKSTTNFSNLTITSDKTPRQLAHFKKVREEVERRKSQGENVVLKFKKGVPTIDTVDGGVSLN